MFIQNVWHECAGLMSISAVLKKNGHGCCVAIGRTSRDFYEDIERQQPDMVGFPVLIGSQDWALQTARDIKEKFGVKIIFGNMYSTLYPEVMEKNNCVDFVCRGEGEMAVLQLMNSLEQKRLDPYIPNLWIRDNGKIYKNDFSQLVDLNTLPFYDRQLYARYKFFRMMPIVVSVDRYCPGNCSFCYEPVLRDLFKGHGQFYRKRSIDLIIEELKFLKDKYYLKSRRNRLLTFASDNLNCQHQWFMEFLERYRKEIGLPFYCSITANVLNEEQAKLLKAANCYLAAFGLESGNEDIRMQVLKKALPTKSIIEAGRLLNKYGVNFYTGNMLGIPGETTEQAFETVSLNIKIRPTTVVAFILQPYPKTAIEKYAMENSYLLQSDVDRFLRTMHRESVINQDNIQELLNLHKLFIPEVKITFLLPLIKRLIKLPPNFIFDFIFLITHTLFYMKKFHRLTLLRLGRYAWHYFYFFRKD